MSPAKISRVLVGVDFDDASAAALRMACALASTWDAAITIFHSSRLEVPAYFTADQIETLEAERRQSRVAATDRLRLFAAQHVRCAVEVIVEEDQPEDALVRKAADFDLVVVGTHRRQGVQRWWLGSVAEAVVRRSRRPVLVVPAGAGLPAAGHPTILAAGGEGGAAAAWVDALRITFGGDVVRSPDLHQCSSDLLQRTDLIVLSMPAWGDPQFGAIKQVLKACVRPVLFIPLNRSDHRKESIMTVESALRLVAGFFVALSVVLGIYVNVNFLWFTLFVGVNLFQSAFTNWCPMMVILRKLGLPDGTRA